MLRPNRSNGTVPLRGRATILDIARAAGVSKGTVSRVLSGAPSSVRISPATQDRVRQAATALDYQPHAAARALGLRRTEQIAVVLPGATGREHVYHRFSHLKLSELLSGIDRVTGPRGYNVILQITTEADPFAESRHSRVWKNRAVDGIIWFGQPLAPQLQTLTCPIVAINAAPLDGLPVSTVNADNYAGSRFAVEHLARLGHSRIAHLAGPPETWNASERKRAYTDVMRELGKRPVIEPAGVFEVSGAAAMRRLLQRRPRPTAVFASGDLVAIGAIGEIRTHGVRVPEDIAIVGSDGVEFARYTAPALSTAGMLMYETARRAAELLLDNVNGAALGVQHIRTPIEFSIGESCGYRAQRPDAPAQVRIDSSGPQLAYSGGTR